MASKTKGICDIYNQNGQFIHQVYRTVTKWGGAPLHGRGDAPTLYTKQAGNQTGPSDRQPIKSTAIADTFFLTGKTVFSFTYRLYRFAIST